MLVGVLATLGYFTNPDAQTGMNWMVHGVISAAILVPAAVLAVMWLMNVVDFFTKREN